MLTVFSIEKQKFFFGKIRPDFPKKSKIRREETFVSSKRNSLFS